MISLVIYKAIEFFTLVLRLIRIFVWAEDAFSC